MCGRATLVTIDPDQLREVFIDLGIIEVPELTPHYNIAPSQPLLVCRDPGKLELMKWGSKFVNAKIEAATVKPQNRCLVVLDGFYEWRKDDRVPFYFHRVDRKPFLVGGVTRSSVAECAIVTCPPSDLIADVHSRMPLVLAPEDWRAWLAGEKPLGSLEGFGRYVVSTHVNNPRNDDASCVAPVADKGVLQAKLF